MGIEFLPSLSLILYLPLILNLTEYAKESTMNRTVSIFVLATLMSTFCLIAQPTKAFSQTSITELGLQTLLDISIDITITFDDNSTAVTTLPANDDALITAPIGKEITKLTAGTKTVDIPMTPSPQTGWNIPNTPPGQTVTAYFEQTSDRWVQAPGYTYSISFSY